MRPNAEIPITNELLRMILDLPADYRIVGSYTHGADHPTVTRLLVEASTLPPVLRDEQRHVIQPIFSRVDTGQAMLDRVQVHLNASPRRPILVVTR